MLKTYKNIKSNKLATLRVTCQIVLWNTQQLQVCEILLSFWYLQVNLKAIPKHNLSLGIWSVSEGHIQLTANGATQASAQMSITECIKVVSRCCSKQIITL